MIEPLGDTMHHRILQPLVMQHGRIDEGCQLRLTANDVFRLVAYAIPDRIERRQFRTLRIDLMHCHVLLSQVSDVLLAHYSTRSGLLSRAFGTEWTPALASNAR